MPGGTTSATSTEHLFIGAPILPLDRDPGFGRAPDALRLGDPTPKLDDGASASDTSTRFELIISLGVITVFTQPSSRPSPVGCQKSGLVADQR